MCWFGVADPAQTLTAKTYPAVAGAMLPTTRRRVGIRVLIGTMTFIHRTTRITLSGIAINLKTSVGAIG